MEVDPETGKVQVLRYTAIQDVGRAIHPSYVEGQIQGGVAQGIGWALNEEYFYDADGSWTTPASSTTACPSPRPADDRDGPRRGAERRHPYGVRGVGEVPMVPALAAVANAIRQATGVRMTDLPMSPPKVLAALDAAK